MLQNEMALRPYCTSEVSDILADSVILTAEERIVMKFSINM